ncbi:MAG: DUF2007 domain-containing protein [Candidatus Zixiibacteriota bacterium]
MDRLEEISVQNTEETPDQNPLFVPLRNCPSRVYAEMLKEALENEGIPCLLKRDDSATGYSVVPPLRKTVVWVRNDDLEKSRKIADQMLDPT